MEKATRSSIVGSAKPGEQMNFLQYNMKMLKFNLIILGVLAVIGFFLPENSSERV